MDVSGQAAELKQQGALEAARDPNSQVTAEDAEHTVIKEARKAGAPAFEFDPNASAEEKAAQANSVGTIECCSSCLQLKADGAASSTSHPVSKRTETTLQLGWLLMWYVAPPYDDRPDILTITSRTTANLLSTTSRKPRQLAS
jgi:hypothetical protein